VVEVCVGDAVGVVGREEGPQALSSAARRTIPTVHKRFLTFIFFITFPYVIVNYINRHFTN
jgi:hypothetical protein